MKSSHSKKLNLRLVETAIAYALAFCFMAYYQFLHPYLPETDGHYHVKMAWLLRQHGFFRHGFPWAQFSLWKDQFSDTAVLFHLYLIPFTFFKDLQWGGKLATVVLSAASFASFFWILLSHQIKHRWLWFWLLLSAGDFYLWRINVPRPQILSVLLMLWSIHFLLKENLKGFTVLCLLYPLSYSAGFLPLAFCGIYCLQKQLFEVQAPWRLLAFGFGGFLVSMVIHPYYPKNIILFYVQNFYVLWLAFFGTDDLSLGQELLPMTTRQLFRSHLAMIIPLCGLFYSLVLRRPVLWKKNISAKTQYLLPIVFSTVVLTALSKRFTEYSVPLTLLFCAFLYTDLYGDFEFLKTWVSPSLSAIQRLLLTFALGVVVCIGILSHSLIRQEFWNDSPSALRSAAEYLRTHAEPGDQVFTCDWDYAPELFFFDDQHHYMVFLDPTFMYYWNPETWRLWTTTSRGYSGNNTYSIIKHDFRAQWGVCKKSFGNLYQIVQKDPRFKMVYEDVNVYVFKLADSR